MELRHLRYFVAVGEEENVSRAAAQLHVTQPALSRQIRDLEDELGVQLLERGVKSVRLTEAGRLFLQEARAVLSRAEEAVRSVRNNAGMNELRVGYAPSLTVEVLPRALRHFQAAFPRTKVLLNDLSTEEIIDGVRQGALHIGLSARSSPSRTRGLVFTELVSYPVRAAVSPASALALKTEIALSDLTAYPMIAYSRAWYPEAYDTQLRIFDELNKRPASIEEHDSVTGLIAAVEAGRGFALLPSCVQCMAGQRLSLITVKPALPPVVVGALRARSANSALSQQFVRSAHLEGSAAGGSVARAFR